MGLVDLLVLDPFAVQAAAAIELRLVAIGEHLVVGQRDRRAPVFFLVAFGLAFVGWAWENWAYVSPSLPISTNPAVNPTDRTVASLVLLSIVTAPVLIGQLLAQREPRTEVVSDSLLLAVSNQKRPGGPRGS